MQTQSLANQTEPRTTGPIPVIIIGGFLSAGELGKRANMPGSGKDAKVPEDQAAPS